MHVNSKRIAILGLLLSINVILIILSGIIEINTLFLLGIASFVVGIAIREYGILQGITFFIASLILGFMLAPNKMYCLTYSAMGLYIVLSEIGWEIVYKISSDFLRKRLFGLVKFIAFNIIYIPILLFAPKLIGIKGYTIPMFIMFFVAGQIALYIFEEAYCVFQTKIWDRYKHRLY